MFTDLLPYLLLIPALLLGILLGYYIAPTLSPQRQGSQQKTVAEDLFRKTTLIIDEGRAKQQAARQELLQLEDQLIATSQLIQQARSENTRQDEILSDLRFSLDEKRALYREHQAEIDEIDAHLKDHQGRSKTLVSTIQETMEEIEALKTVEQQSVRKRDRLMQTVQNLTNELSLLEGTVQSKSLEIQEAEKIRGDRDTYLSRLHRERRTLETEINRLHQDIEGLDTDLQALSERQRQLSTPEVPEPANTPSLSRAVLPDDDHDTPPPFTDEEWEFLPEDVALLHGEDDLSLIEGVNNFYLERLHKKGIKTYAQLAYARPDELFRLLDIPPHYEPDLKGWIATARDLFRQQTAQEL